MDAMCFLTDIMQIGGSTNLCVISAWNPHEFFLKPFTTFPTHIYMHKNEVRKKCFKTQGKLKEKITWILHDLICNFSMM